MTLPTLFDLQTHGEKLTAITKLKTDSSWYLDILAKQFIGSFDTTKYGSIPMIFVGLLPFILTILFFTIKSIRFHVKLTYVIFFTFFNNKLLHRSTWFILAGDAYPKYVFASLCLDFFHSVNLYCSRSLKSSERTEDMESICLTFFLY